MHTHQQRAEWVRTFKDKLEPSQGDVDVFEAALEVAAPEYGALPAAELRGQLDAWARAARQRLAELAGVPRTAGLLAGVCHVLFREAGFCGDRDEYTDPRNSFLNEVIARRRGLPITLSILFVEVARRVGLEAHGVAFPGHFLARVDDPDDEDTFVIVDSFAGGNIMGVAELQALLAQHAGAGIRLSPSMLAPAGPKVILARMLRNLKATYTERSDYSRALLAQERLLVLTGDEPTEIRDHGLLLAGAREPGAAVGELQRYVTLVPDAQDVEEVQRTIKMLHEHAFNVQ